MDNLDKLDELFFSILISIQHSENYSFWFWHCGRVGRVVFQHFLIFHIICIFIFSAFWLAFSIQNNILFDFDIVDELDKLDELDELDKLFFSIFFHDFLSVFINHIFIMSRTTRTIFFPILECKLFRSLTWNWSSYYIICMFHLL